MFRFLPLVLFLACTNTPPGGDVPSQTLSLKAAGLWLTSNPLDAPDGALAEAKNMVIRRPGVVEKRRGQAPDTTMGGTIDAVTWFDGSAIGHTASNTLEKRVDSTTSTPYSGTYVPPSGSWVRFAQAGGALYFTTDQGVTRLDSATATPAAAGMPPGLEGSATTVGSSGWLATGMAVGYRATWAQRDGDGDLLEGAPSGRIIVTNSSGASRDVSLTFPIPAGITANTSFLRLYRTVNVVSSGADPGEDMAQVAEYFPTPDDIVSGTVKLTDIASFATGATAYFSPSLGPGLADAKQQPPLLTDMVVFKGHMFGVVQSYRTDLEVALLSVSGSDGLQVFEGLTFTDGITTETYYCDGVPADEGTQPGPGFRIFFRDTTGTVSQNIENTARSLVRVLNGYSSLVTATYSSSSTDLPGKFIVTARKLAQAPIQIRAYKNRATWSPQFVQDMRGLPNRSGSTVTVDTIVNHHLKVGDVVNLLVGDANFPPGHKTVVSVPSSFTFTYTEAGAAGGVTTFDWETVTEPVYLNQEANTASYAFSAFQEYDAWPPRFRFQVGGPTNVLYRITAQGNALLFWTSEGLYRLTGEDEDSFILRPMDTTYVLAAPNSPTTVRGQAFALTTRGVVAVTDESSTVVSGAMEQQLLRYYGSEASKRTLTAASAFAVGYESEGEYVLFLPSLTATPGDPATFAYTFSTKTGTWVGPWEFSWAGINAGTKYVKTGMVGDDGFLYLASSNRLTRERKDRAPSDYQDTTGAGIPSEVTWQVQTASNPGLYKQWVETTMFMEAPQPSSVDVAFTTEIDTTPEGGNIPSLGNLNIRTGIPRDKSRSARLNVSMANGTSQENMSILGLSVIYNAASQKVGR